MRDEIEPVVRTALGPQATIETCRIDDMGWLNVMAGRLSLATGTATIGRSKGAPWSVLLKSVRPAEGNETAADPAAWNYWRREVDAYVGGALRALPGDIAVPACYGVIEREDGTIVLALEFVRDTVDDTWSPGDFERHARRIGRLGGAYLSGTALPAERSLRRGGLRSWVEGLRAAVIAEPADTWQRPLAATVLGDHDLGRLMSSVPLLLDALERLPHTFTHRDVTPGNLLVRRQGPPVLIDWALAGQGPIGEESACSVHASLWQFLVEPSSAAVLDKAVLAGYIAGLRDAGWDGPVETLRFGHSGSMGLRSGLAVVYWAARLATTTEPAWFERRFGRSLIEIADGWHGLFQLAVNHWSHAVAAAGLAGVAEVAIADGLVPRST
jgi:hypothetical protein